MKRLYGTLLAVTLLLSAMLPSKADAITYGLGGTSSIYPSLGGYSSSLGSYGSYGGYGGYGSYGGYSPYGSSGSYGSCGGYSGCGGYGGYRPQAYGVSIRVSGYYNYGGYGYGYGGGYGGYGGYGYGGGCGSHGCVGGGYGGYGGGWYGGGHYARHQHRGHGCCKKKRKRSFSLNLAFGGFRLGIRSVSF